MKYRWLVLFVFMLNGMSTQMLWITFAPIARDVAAIYTGGDTDKIDLLALVFMLLYIPVSFPASWCIDKFGLKKGTGIGVVMVGIFGFLRAFSPDFTWLLIFQVGCAIGQPFVLNSFTKVAANWFSEKEAAIANGLATVSMLLGLIIAMFSTGPIVSYYKAMGNDKTGIDVILLIFGIYSLVAMFLYLILVKDKPAIPANAHGDEVKLNMTRGLKALFRNRDFIYLLLIFFIGLGAFNAITAKVDVIFNRPLSIMSDVTTGLMGGLIIAGGVFGAGILAALSDKYRKRKLFIVLILILAIPLTLMLAYTFNYILLCFVCFFFGFFLVAALPIGLTYATEKTHPVPEATSNGMLMLAGQISGIVFVLGFNMLALAALFAVGLLLSLKLREIED